MILHFQLVVYPGQKIKSSRTDKNERAFEKNKKIIIQVNSSPFADDLPSLKLIKTPQITSVQKLGFLAFKMAEDSYSQDKSPDEIVRDFLLGVKRLREEKPC